MAETKKKIEASLGITKNLGNFESARIEARAEEQVEDIHDQEEWKKLWAEVEKQVEDQLLELAEGLSE